MAAHAPIDRVWLVAALGLAAAACGGEPAKAPADPTAGVISGSVNGTSWTSLSNAYWIGKPLAGSPPVIVFLFEAPVRCADIVNVNWDKTPTGARQILEIAIQDSEVRSHQIMTDVFAAYLLGAYNPDAYTGTVTVSAVNPMVDLVGAFDLHFLTDSLTGTFDAKYCPDGVEP